MTKEQESLQTLQDIRQMMDRSSRFISLSGLSGIGAGLCALAGAWVAHDYVSGEKEHFIDPQLALTQLAANDYAVLLNSRLFWIAAATFVSAILVAFIFTWMKSKRDAVPVWGTTARRLMLSVTIPLIAGGIFLFRLLQFDSIALVAPGCLIFYGLALVNASRFTLSEIRYLGYTQISIGIINLWFLGYGLYFWAAGFGILHIVYGFYMWKRYERSTAAN